jgi:dynein heavy chain
MAQWCKQCEVALRAECEARTHMHAVSKESLGLLRDMVDLASSDVNREHLINLEALITIQAHQQDVIQNLIATRTKSLHGFEWQKQLRCYWRGRTLNSKICIMDVELNYSDEYIGCQQRLVITPLTDRCYIALAQISSIFSVGSSYMMLLVIVCLLTPLYNC